MKDIFLLSEIILKQRVTKMGQDCTSCLIDSTDRQHEVLVERNFSQNAPRPVVDEKIKSHHEPKEKKKVAFQQSQLDIHRTTSVIESQLPSQKKRRRTLKLQLLQFAIEQIDDESAVSCLSDPDSMKHQNSQPKDEVALAKTYGNLLTIYDVPQGKRPDSVRSNNSRQSVSSQRSKSQGSVRYSSQGRQQKNSTGLEKALGGSCKRRRR